MLEGYNIYVNSYNAMPWYEEMTLVKNVLQLKGLSKDIADFRNMISWEIYTNMNEDDVVGFRSNSVQRKKM